MSNGIDFVIGGKDKAAPAFASTEKGLARLEAGTKSLKTATQSLMSSMAPLLAVLAAVKTVMAAIGGVKAANEAYDKQTEAVKRLNSALQIRGAAGASKQIESVTATTKSLSEQLGITSSSAEKTSEQLKGVAADAEKLTGVEKRVRISVKADGLSSVSQQMQKVAKDLETLTGVSDQSTLALMHSAQSMGFATDKMDDAAKAAMGLAEATGKTAEQSLGDMKAALEGNFEAFHGLNPQIMFMRTNQEKLAAVMAIANQGLQQQSQDMGTVAGSGRRADSAMGSLMESFGKIIAPIRVLINAGIQQLATSLDTLMIPIVQYATQVLENIGPIMDWVKEKVVAAINVIIGAFTFFEVILTNLSSVWEIVKAAAELAMISISESVMHTLTEVIPAYAMWFGENFINLIKDAFNGVITVITNAGKIIGEMVYQIFEFIASGGAGGIDGLMAGLGQTASMSLTDGFKSSLTSLPEIAARQLTEREKDLADKIGAVGGRLGQEFSDKMSERMVGVGSTLGDELSAATSAINLKGRPAIVMQGVQATEGRLLTRGPGSSLPNLLEEIRNLLKNPPKPPEKKILVQIDPQQMQTWDEIKENTSNTVQMEAIA